MLLPTRVLRTMFFGSVLVAMTASSASAATVIFTYTVTGRANATIDPVTNILSYAFVPSGPVATTIGSLTVNYSGDLDLTLLPPSGPTTATWDVAGRGSFFGPGTEAQFAADPETLIAPFEGTSTIAGGTGVFAGASGSTSYTGSFNVATGIAQFVERIEITGPNVSAVPEPATWGMMLLGFAGIGAVIRRRRATAVRVQLQMA